MKRIHSNIVSLFMFLFLMLIFQSCLPEVEIPEEEKETGNFINRVFEYVYAPGQHANLAMPTDTTSFKGNPSEHSKWIYLGGFGGYVVGAFEKNVVNKDGADFEVFALKGSSPEPAIVYVMQDTNGDGLPNETWYELKGNQNDSTIRNYWVRYFKPKTNEINISWKDSRGDSGELIPGYGAQYSAAWWWSFSAGDSITLRGSRLPDAYDNESIGESQYWVVPRLRFTDGYAENIYGTDYDATKGSNRLDISNAIDSMRNTVHLPDIRFIKVQTAVFQRAGWVNEVSSEIRGARELEFFH